MKHKLLYLIKICTSYLFMGIILQTLFFPEAFADEINAQRKNLEDVKVSIDLKDASFSEFISQVEQQTEFTFFFANAKVNKAKKITLKAFDATLADVLKEMSQMTGVAFKQVNYNIGIFRKEESKKMVEKEVEVYQPITITGSVSSSDNGELLPGVSVVEKNTGNGTITDINGAYTIQVQSGSTLTFSFVGYKTQEKSVETQSVINVSLEPDIKHLQELVVVGYGTQRESTLTGAVSKLSAQRIEVQPVVSVESALQGQVAGVTVVNNGGPGTTPTVRIRGIGSVNFASDPLYVIDGIPVTNINNFNTKDIETISVLKDAAASAIYGSRAANGVVLITTKSGKSEKNTLSVDASYGFQQAWRKLDLMNRDEYLQFGTQYLQNAGQQLPYRFQNMNEPIYAGASQTYAQTDTDWQDEMFQVAPIAQININYSGGNEKTKFYTAYNRFAQDGIMLGTDFNRHTFRLNTDSRLNKFLKIGENINLSFSEQSRERVAGGRTLVKHIVNQAPFVPVHNPNSISGFGGPNGTDGSDAENPVRIASIEKDQTSIVSLVGNVYAELDFTDWLSFRSTVGLEYISDRSTLILPIFADGTHHERGENQLTDNRFSYLSPVFTNQLTFDKTFGKHYVNAIAVVEQQRTSRVGIDASGRQATNDINYLSGAFQQEFNATRHETYLQSYIGRVNYAYDDKYLANVSFRRDGSSVFAPGNKWGNFPGASLGWVASKESFMEDIDLISNLKLKASYGTVGFNAVEAYPWQSVVYTNTTAVFNNSAEGNNGAYFHRTPNRELEWEITTMSNFGFDLELLKNKVFFSAEYFVRQTDNLIINQPLPASLGYRENPVVNIGSMKNWGYEFIAGYRQSVGDLNFSVDGNITFLNNKVLELAQGQSFIEMRAGTGDYGGGVMTRTETGHPIQGFYGYQVEGIFQTQEEINDLNPDPANDIYYQNEHTSPGDIRFRDVNGDGIVDENDQVFLGSHLPDFTYGMNLSASYKGFSASMLIQGVHGNKIYNGTKVLTQGMMRLFNGDRALLNAWTPNNTDTDIPRAYDGDPNNNARTSDRFLEDGSYLRIKNVTLGYTVPQSKLSSISRGTFSGLNFYITAQNLLTFTKYTGYDPEIGASQIYSGNNANLLQGVDFGFFPQPRTVILGVNMSF